MEFAEEYSTVNANALIEKWETYEHQLREILVINFANVAFETGWSEDIENVLVLLKLLPSKQSGRNVIASNSTFNNAIEKLVQFLPV